MLSRGILIYTQHETSWIGNMFLSIKTYMKTITIPLTSEISISLQEIVTSSPLGNSVGVMHDPVATELPLSYFLPHGFCLPTVTIASTYMPLGFSATLLPASV